MGSTLDNPYQWVGALGYYTHYQAPEFKLIQLGFRFYDPESGRFTQQDPIGDGLNWYQYALGSPTRYSDPSGLIVPIIGAVAAGGLGGGIIGGIAGGVFAWLDGENIWDGVWKGAATGAVAGAAGALTGFGVAGWLGGGVLGGIGGGVAGGAVGNAASQGLGLGLGWQDQFSLEEMGISAAAGGVFGGLAWRPTNAPLQQVSRWGGPIQEGGFVMVGPPSFRNSVFAGVPQRYFRMPPTTGVVPGSQLAYPEGLEWIKGLLGQRLVCPCK